jgi:hypothetical protein
VIDNEGERRGVCKEREKGKEDEEREQGEKSHHDSKQRSKHDNITRQESSQTLCRFLDLPRTSNPTT